MGNKKFDGGPAFPCKHKPIIAWKDDYDLNHNLMPIYNGNKIPVFGEEIYETGMSLRDYFAAKAMLSLMPILEHDSGKDNTNRMEAVCVMAYQYADTMLKTGGLKSES